MLCVVLKPIETKNLKLEDVEDLARDTRELMLKELLALTAKARGRPVPVPARNSNDGALKKANGIKAS